ncbi:tyrosine-protein kinase Etk/Wzc [Paraburkholderia eburnea]|uniref:Putative tyrosine-protein kinase EpsB n=1 Tax=Paraburkholderia eburnea TaxID=1189126 RepID=A0A2S4LSD7_9BURK|nr:polysaccharide biosynthesis tyrosine autokinase [Paraburkholderia eburnea]POR45259.1 tyrosine-protein kinase Etk/Wzc [Paraburkholderia eburnea]PRZ12748.1 tyrosine-protein kinase Etk/Wzc [Paraburkholderia eburnea]
MNPSIKSVPTSAEKSELDLGYYLDMVISHRWLIAIIASAFLAMGMLYACFASPVYRADIMLQVEDSSDGVAGGNLVSSVSSLFQVKSVTAGEIEILRSRLVVSHAVDKLKLYIDASPSYFPLIGRWIARHNADGLSRPGIFGMGGFAWSSESIEVDQFDVPAELEGEHFFITALGDDSYRLSGEGFDNPVEGKIGKPETFRSSEGDVFLTVTKLSGKRGARFKITRSSRLTIIGQIQKDLEIQEMGKQQSDVIGVALRGTDPVLISKIMNEIGREYVRQNVDRKTEEAGKSLQFLQEQLPKMKAALEDAEQNYNNYREKHGTLDIGTEGKLVLQQSVEAQTQLLALKQRRADLLTRFGPEHPSILAINQQISELEKASGGVDERIEGMPSTEQDVVRFERDVEVRKALYLALLQSSQQLNLLKAGKVGTVRMVDSAPVPEVPVWPAKALVIPISVLVGLVVGFAAAFVKTTFFGGVDDPLEIEQRAGLNVYATIPHADLQRGITAKADAKSPHISILALAHPEEPAVESLRSLRTSLQFALLEARNNVVLVTGPAPGVGKSFLSINFAALIAAGGKRVILIDADMRKGHLNQSFGQARPGGLSELLAGDASISSAIRKTTLSNLDFMATGIIPSNPAELLLRPRLGEIVAECSRIYDIVIVDAPPILAVTDAAILAPHAGSTFLVARAHTTKMGELVESARRVELGGGNVTGVLLNGIKVLPGRYGYGSTYGNYRYVSYDYTSEKS